MTRITIDRAVVEHALEALEKGVVCKASWIPACADAIIALRAALTEFSPDWDRIEPLQENLREHMAEIQRLRAKLAEPVEPVAWAGYDLDEMVEAFSRVIEAHHSSHHPFHNPIDMDAKRALRILRGFIPAMKAYAAPPQRKPLMEDVATELVRSVVSNSPRPIGMVEYGMLVARAVERAHGIVNFEEIAK